MPPILWGTGALLEFENVHNRQFAVRHIYSGIQSAAKSPMVETPNVIRPVGQDKSGLGRQDIIRG